MYVTHYICVVTQPCSCWKNQTKPIHRCDLALKCCFEKSILTKNCAHTLSCVPLQSFRSRWGWKSKIIIIKTLSTRCTSVVRKPTKQNRCFYLRMSSTGHCKGGLDDGLSFCCPKIRRVCWGMRSRPGQTAPWPGSALTSRWLLQRSGRVQRFQGCYHYWCRRCSHRRLSCWCRCWCQAQNSPRQHFAVAGCLTSL